VTVRQWLGSIAFTLFLFLSVPVYGSALMVIALVSGTRTYGVVTAWVDAMLLALRVCCRLDYTVEGQQNLPKSASIVLMKHSSTWETLAQVRMFPRQTWVLKRELLWIPFFGWALRMLRPIAIDRKGGGAAVQQVLDQGRRRLDAGVWVVIFPEGTRVAAGQSRRYGLSGALLASATGKLVVPVAHNAGYYWPRHGLLKRSGTIRVVIGEPIATAGVDARQINEQVQRWIDAQHERIKPAGR
jgi:1-acyl-sn-glycerol-3-phosphate acyltransferase